MTASQPLVARIEGTPQGRILREFATNSGLFPLFDAIRLLTTDTLRNYVSDPAHWLLLLSAAVQSWFLGRKPDYHWAERAAGNLIAAGLYTITDIVLEGPAEFVSQPYHWVFWAFSLGMALLHAAESLLPRLKGPLVLLASLWRVLLFPVLYVLSELGGEMRALTGEGLRAYWASSSGHSFILLASLLFGLLLGLNEAEISRYTDVLRRVARRLKQFSEWTLGADLLAESLDNSAALSQRRAERVVVFMDIRGFTAWSEDKDPETVVGMLNRFYERAEQIILAGSGHKPHFIGDEVMTWFSDPMAAVETTRILKRETADLLARYKLASGLGVHLGEVVEGLMGSSETRSYNIIGDTVNTAARLCAAARPGEALLSEQVASRLAMVAGLGPPREIQAKGKQELLRVYPL